MIEPNSTKHQEHDKRSNHWPQTRKNFIEKNPTCAMCGRKEQLEVHHIEP